MWFSSRTAPEVKVKQILYQINLNIQNNKKQHKWLDFQNKGERILSSLQVTQINIARIANAVQLTLLSLSLSLSTAVLQCSEDAEFKSQLVSQLVTDKVTY